MTDMVPRTAVATTRMTTLINKICKVRLILRTFILLPLLQVDYPPEVPASLAGSELWIYVTITALSYAIKK